ncbi:MAG: RNA 2',3'-cyclic phosphodiesterase [Acidobacteriia bacterium]|nr:RNA 2',3'-cyclic phosphodiesterase [Terriglobia bacterium]
MRLFVAIDLPEDVRDHVKTLLDRLRPTAKITWSPVENMHITTKFIGEWPQERLEEMQAAIQGVDSPGPIEISIRGLGWFPNARHPRVFWAGIDAERELALLADATEAAVGKIGVPKEDRKFSPHLTLARIREKVPLDALMRAIDALPPVEFGTFRAASYYLYLSRGGKYTRLAEFALA